MDRLTFFLEAMDKHQRYKEKSWVLSVFAVKDWGEGDVLPKEPYQVGVKDGFYITKLKDEEEYTFILEKGKPIPTKKTIVDLKEEVKLKAYTVPNQSKDIVTTPALIFMNYYILIHSFGKKIPYANGKLHPNDLVKEVVPRIVDNIPSTSRAGNSNDIYVDEAVTFISAMTSFSGFALLNAPSATPYTMMTSPEVKRLRDQLLKENAGQLTDPVVVSNITKQLLAEDKKWLDKDPNAGFYVKSKTLNVGRKKVHLLHGLEYDMAGKPQFIGTSISEGIKVENLPTLIDGMRDGSHSRGAMTALGGEAVKFLFRVFNASSIIKDDCGTKLGLPIDSDEVTLKNNMLRYVNVAGTSSVINERTLPLLVGKKLTIRSPGYCQADKEGRKFCLRCFSESFRGAENALSVYGSAVSSQMMYIFMKAMHGKSSETVKWDPRETLS